MGGEFLKDSQCRSCFVIPFLKGSRIVGCFVAMPRATSPMRSQGSLGLAELHENHVLRAYAPQAYAGAVLTICSVSPRTVPSNAQCSRAARKS